jgi:hypothetical protein
MQQIPAVLPEPATGAIAEQDVVLSTRCFVKKRIELDHGLDLADRQTKMFGNCAHSLVGKVQKLLLEDAQNLQQVPGLSAGTCNGYIQGLSALCSADRIHGWFTLPFPPLKFQRTSPSTVLRCAFPGKPVPLSGIA